MQARTIADREESSLTTTGSPDFATSLEPEHVITARESVEQNASSSESLHRLLEGPPQTEAANIAIEYGRYIHPRQQHIVVGLLNRGRDTLAQRVASCGNRRKTEHRKYYCDHPRLCWKCREKKGGEAQEKYSAPIREWDKHWYSYLTMGNVTETPVEARSEVIDTWRSFRDRVAFQRAVTGAFGGIHVVETDEGYRAHLDMLTDTPLDSSSIYADWRDCGGGIAESQPLGWDDSPSYGVAVIRTTAYVVEKTRDLSPEASVNYALSTKGAHWTRHQL